MNKDRAIGAIILVASIAGIIIYGWLIYAWPLIVIQITAFLGIAVVLVILAWIGWTMATTPAPAPIEPEPIVTSPEQAKEAGEKKEQAF